MALFRARKKGGGEGPAQVCASRHTPPSSVTAFALSACTLSRGLALRCAAAHTMGGGFARMSLPVFSAFALAVTILMLIPGPNVALIAANSIAHGARYGLTTVAGTSAAMVLQLALTGLGMTALMGELARAFEVLRWLGVAYLIWLGVTRLAPAGDRPDQDQAASARERRDFRPRLSCFADEPEDAAVLRGVFPAIRRRERARGAADCSPCRDLPRHRRRRRQRMGAACGAVPRIPRAQWPIAQSAYRRLLLGRRGSGSRWRGVDPAGSSIYPLNY